MYLLLVIINNRGHEFEEGHGRSWGRRKKGRNDGNLVLMSKILQKVKLNLKQPTSNVGWTKSKFKFKTTHKQGADTQEQLVNLKSGGKHSTVLENCI